MTIKRKKKWCKSAIVGAASSVAISAALAPDVFAQTPGTKVEVSVAAQPLSDALIIISDIYGVSIFGDENLIRNKLASPTDGTYTVQKALDAVLLETGLKATPSKGGGFVIAVEKISAESNSDSGQDVSATSQADIETITVLGKFQQSLIDRIPVSPDELPFSINLIDRSVLDLRNFTAPFDTLALQPNIDLDWDVFGIGFDGAVIRGYRGDVLINNRLQNSGGPRDDSFVERYEVLKGPASIALGPTLPGGVINTVLKSPTAEAFTTFEVSTDQFGTIDSEFDINPGAIGSSKSARARVSGAFRDFQFDANEEARRSLAVRPVAEFDLSDTTRIQASVAVLSAETRPNNGFALFSDGSVPEEFDTSITFGIEGGETDIDDTFVEGQLTHDFLDNLRLTVRGSYQDTNLTEYNSRGFDNYRYDDGIPGVGLNNPTFVAYAFVSDNENDNKFFDAQLAGNVDFLGERQDFVIGASYNKLTRDSVSTSFDTITDISIDDILAGPVSNSRIDRSNPGLFLSSREQRLKSAYAEFALRPLYWLSIIGGLRYDDTTTESSVNNVVQTPFSNDNLTFRLGVNAEIYPNLRAYISVAESFVPQSGFIFGGGEATPSEGISYEVGLKGHLFDGVVSFETALFETTRKNIAVFDSQNSMPGGDQFVTLIGEQRNRGIELTADIRPIDGVNVNISYGHLDIDVISAAEFVGGETAPADNTFSAFATYAVQDGLLRGLTLGAGPRYVGERQSPQQPDFAYPDFWVSDAVIRYEITNELSAQLNILNITDKLYLKNAGAGFGLLTGSNSFGEPRTYRFTLSGRF